MCLMEEGLGADLSQTMGSKYLTRIDKEEMGGKHSCIAERPDYLVKMSWVSEIEMETDEGDGKNGTTG